MNQTNAEVSSRRAASCALWLPTLILLIGASLRLGAFQEALIGADQSSILATAADIAALRDLPGVGIKSSIGVMQTAMTGYLAALPLLIVHRVIAIKWFFSVLDVLAIAFLYRAVCRTFGRGAAALAALLYATNPWVVEFNRWIWYQSLVATFATVAFAALLPLTLAKPAASPWSLAVAVVAGTLMGLVHLAAVPWTALIIVIALGIAACHRWWRAAALGVAGSLIVASPYLGFLIKSGFADVNYMLSRTTSTAGSWNTAAYRLSGELLTGRQVLQTPRNDLWSHSVLEAGAFYWIVPVALGLATVWGALVSGKRRTTGRWALVFTMCWGALAPTLFLPTSIHLQHFYLLFLFPAPFVLIGAAMGTMSGSRQVWIRGGAKAVSLSLVALSLWWTHLWVVRIGYEQEGELRAPTRAWLMDRSAAEVEKYLSQHPTAQVIILTHFGGESSAFDWVRNFVGTDRVRTVPVGKALIIPATETCYMLAERADAKALEPLSDQVELRPEMTIPAEQPWTFHCAPGRPPLPPPLATWENGLSLLDTKASGRLSPGERLHLMHTWHYDTQTHREYHLFNHLMHGEQDLVAQIDGEGVPKRYWRDEDVFITYFDLDLPAELPAGKLELRVGAYTWPAIERVPLITGEDAWTVREWTP